jgi:small nuclear ribonucleoprotein (snRNP)-like protein
MANERLAKFKNDKTKVILKTYSNKLYTGVVVHVDNYYVELNTHSNIVERFELGEVMFIDEGCRG